MYDTVDKYQWANKKMKLKPFIIGIKLVKKWRLKETHYSFLLGAQFELLPIVFSSWALEWSLLKWPNEAPQIDSFSF